MKIFNFRLLMVLLCTVSLNAAFAQQIGVRGRIVDDSGTPLAGVAVVVKGTNKGTVSNDKGEYSIKVNSERDTLTFNFIGYTPQEKVVGKNRVINIRMEDSSLEMEEVVVVGYGVMKRRDLTGSVSSIQASEIAKVPVSNVAEALTGKLAGVQVTTTEGEPGAEIKIRVRGGGSITQDNSPLYIVDGFPSDLGLDGVDPNNIESIDVLKDASSTSIYGARGANGVVIVTTKGGKEGKFNVSYNGYVGFRKISKTLPLLNSLEYAKSQWERSARSVMVSGDISEMESSWGAYQDMEANYGDRPCIDWQDQVFGRTALVHSHNVAINGGTKATTYNFGFTRNDEEGILMGSGYERNSFNFKFNTKANDKVTFSASANYMDRKTDGNGTSEVKDNSSAYSPLINILTYAPFGGGSLDEFLDEEFDEESNETTALNPNYMVSSILKERLVRSVQFNGAMTYKIHKNLSLRVSGGYNRTWDDTNTFYTAISDIGRRNGGPSGTMYEQDKDKWNTSNTLTYTKKFGRDHDLTVMVGQEANKLHYFSKTLTAYGFPNEDMGFSDLKQATTKELESNEYSESILSFFGRVNYSYKGRYLFSASLRRDGSSKFAKENRWGNFPAASVGWRISDESFFQPLQRVVNNLKLRYSYGQAGNNRISNFLYSTNYKSVYYGLDNTATVGLVPNSLSNPDLKWETTITSNIGLDFGLFNNRISGTIEYYNNKTKDLLLNANTSSISGYTTQMKNIGSTRNRGFEVVLSAVIMNKKDFTWTANFNISANRNKVLKLNGQEDFMKASSGWGNVSTDYIVRVGQPIGLIYGYISDGMYTANDFIDAVFDPSDSEHYGKFIPDNLKPGIPYNSSQAKDTNLLGIPKLKRIGSSPDSKTTEPDLDQTVIGDTNPKHFGGFNTTFQYKGFDLSIFLNWVYGNDVYNATLLRGVTQMYSRKNIIKQEGQRYSVVDPQTGVPVVDRDRLNQINANATLYAASTKAEYLTNDYVEDGSFLRLNNVTIGYTFPTPWLKKIRVQKLRIYATGYNLATITGYSGYDPEVDTRRKTPLTPGVDYSAYPRSRQFIFGINVTF